MSSCPVGWFPGLSGGGIGWVLMNERELHRIQHFPAGRQVLLLTRSSLPDVFAARHDPISLVSEIRDDAAPTVRRQ
jgi:hypothetical protein